MKSARWSFVLLLLLCPACPNGSSTPDGRLDLPTKQDGKAMTPSPTCDDYLACLAAAEPQSFPAALQTYQAGGPCWKSQTAADGCTRACKEAHEALRVKYPGVPACQPRADAGVGEAGRPDGPFKPPFTTREVDILFMVDNSNSMEPKQAKLVSQFPALIDALRSPKLGPAAPGAPCTAADPSGCKLPNLRIGVISSDLGAGNFSFNSCEVPGGDGGKLHSTAGKLATPGCATPRDPWISYTVNASGDAVTNVQNAKSPDPVSQVKEAFSCIAYLGVGGCGFEQSLESARKALSPGVNPGFVRPNSLLVLVLLTDEDDCSAKKNELFDPSQQGLGDPLGPLSSFRCTEFGLVCKEALRPVGEKHNCVPGLDYLFSVSEYASFFKALRPAGNFLVAAIAGPVPPVLTVKLDGSIPTLAPSCPGPEAPFGAGGVPAVRLKAVADALGPNGLFNKGLVGSTTAEVNICSDDYSPVLRLVGSSISVWY